MKTPDTAGEEQQAGVPSGTEVTPMSFQEAMHLVRLPSTGPTQRYMSTRAAYLPGQEFNRDSVLPQMHRAAFGGHVYAQSGLAAVQTWQELEAQKGAGPSDRLDLHTIHGYFTLMGIPTRPFLYSVTPLSASRSFATVSVVATQPTAPSNNPAADEFPPADAALPQSSTSFAALCSFKLPEPDSAGVNTQEPSVQQRFTRELAARPPEEWPPAPPVDITGIVEAVGADFEAEFPIAEMRKVDMTAWNEGRAVHERRELVLYRLRRPLADDGKDGYDANAHVLVHAYVADRNGLLVAGNNLGFGYSLARAASLSYSFVMHTAAAEAMMKAEDGWWVQELSFPRAGAGRGIVMSKIWSPAGVHVATEYQDGLIRGFEDKPEKGKL